MLLGLWMHRSNLSVSARIFTWSSPLCLLPFPSKNTCHLIYGHTNPGWSHVKILNLITYAEKLFFQIRSQSQILGRHIFWGGHYSTQYTKCVYSNFFLFFFFLWWACLLRICIPLWFSCSKFYGSLALHQKLCHSHAILVTAWINMSNSGFRNGNHLPATIKPYSSVSAISCKGDSLVSHLPYSSISSLN